MNEPRNYVEACDWIAELDAKLAALSAERDRLREAAKAFQELNACYRLGRQPSERLFARLETARATLTPAPEDAPRPVDDAQARRIEELEAEVAALKRVVTEAHSIVSGGSPIGKFGAIAMKTMDVERLRDILSTAPAPEDTRGDGDGSDE